MRFLKLAIGLLAVLVATVTAIPTNSPPPDFDLSIFNGTAQSIKDITNQQADCGQLTTIDGFSDPLFTSNLCTAASLFEPWKWIDNTACGLCMVFDGYDCQGKMLWWGGPSPNRVKLDPPAGSFFCE